MPFPLTFLAEKELACPTLPCAAPGELPYSYIMQSKGWETQAEKRIPYPLITLPKVPSRVIFGLKLGG
jgi:hypothetical protein